MIIIKWCFQNYFICVLILFQLVVSNYRTTQPVVAVTENKKFQINRDRDNACGPLKMSDRSVCGSSFPGNVFLEAAFCFLPVAQQFLNFKFAAFSSSSNYSSSSAAAPNSLPCFENCVTCSSCSPSHLLSPFF